MVSIGDTMQVLTPMEIKDPYLLSSTVAEPTVGIDPSIWVSGNGYVIGDQVYVASTHKVYTAISGIAAGSAASMVSPHVDIQLAIPKWTETGSTNRWNMFDLFRNTATICDSPTTVIFNVPPDIETGESDPYYDNVVLLLQNITGTTPIDYSKYARVPVTVDLSGLALDTTTMSGKSLNFTGGFLQYADSPEWQMQTNYTIEIELMFNSASMGDRVIILGQCANSGADSSFNLGKSDTDKITTSYRNNVGGYYVTESTLTVLPNVKYHIAIVKLSNTLTVYCNGVIYIQLAVSGSMLDSAYKFGVGIFGEYNYAYGGTYGTKMMGWVKTLRVTNGVARYIADSFTVPAMPFATINYYATYNKSLAILDLVNVGSVLVETMYHNGTSEVVITSDTYYMNTRNVYDWWTYFTTQFIPKKSLVLSNLPSGYFNLKIAITFTGSTGMSVGVCAVGNSTLIGRLQHGAELDILNFSTMERDTFGNAVLVPRKEVSTLSANLFVDKSIFESVQLIKSDLDARPAIWIGIDDPDDPYYHSLIFLGIYRDFNFQLDNPIGPTASLEVEEL